MQAVNLQPLKDLGLDDKKVEIVLMSLTPLLQGLIDEELGRTLTDEEEDLIEEATKEKPVDTLIAYDEIYKLHKGRSIQEFSNETLNELIERMKDLPTDKLDEFKKLVEEEKFEDAEKLILND
jgi:hypothetical protein